MTLKDQYIESLLQTPNAVTIAEKRRKMVKLRSGRRSNVYFNHRALMPNPKTREPFIQVLDEKLRSKFDPSNSIIAPVDSVNSPLLSFAIAREYPGYRYIVEINNDLYRREGQKYTSLWMPEIKNGDKVVIIDDVMTAGDKTAIDIADRIRRKLWDMGMYLHTFHLVVGLVRDEQKARQELRKAGISLDAITTDREVLQKGWATFNSKQRRRLQKEFPNLVDI